MQAFYRSPTKWCAALLIGAASIAASACGRSLLVSRTVGVTPAEMLSTASRATGSAGDDDSAPAVVVRDYWRSPAADVFGWDPEDAAFGLRAKVRTDGSLIRDHQLYVSVYEFINVREYYKAVAWSKNLEFTGTTRDAHACDGEQGCTPYITVGLRIPDSLLRANRDSMVVTFYTRRGDETTFAMRRDVVDAYLATVDSLKAARRLRIVADRSR